VEAREGLRHLCRRLARKPVYTPTQTTGKGQPNREQQKVPGDTGTRLNVATTSLLMITDNLVGVVQRRYKLIDEILLLY
jgi:hypothetical protein